MTQFSPRKLFCAKKLYMREKFEMQVKKTANFTSFERRALDIKVVRRKLNMHNGVSHIHIQVRRKRIASQGAGSFGFEFKI